MYEHERIEDFLFLDAIETTVIDEDGNTIRVSNYREEG